MKKDGNEKENMKEVAEIYREMADIIDKIVESEDEKEEEELTEQLILRAIKIQMIQNRI